MTHVEALWNTAGLIAIIAFIFVGAATFPNYNWEKKKVAVVRGVFWSLAVASAVSTFALSFIAIWSEV